jgi:hypothetical protein
MIGCGSNARAAAWALIAVQGPNLPAYFHVKDLKRLLRCDNCGERGKVDLTIIWADS